MTAFNAAWYPLIAATAIVLAACQPAVDQAAQKAGDQIEKAGDKVKDAVEDAKK